MDKAKVDVDVTEIVTAAIQAEVVKALGKDPQVLIDRVVSAAMEQKQASYTRQTVFQQAVNKMIREAGQEIFRKWLEDQKSVIEKAILRRLKEKPEQFIETVAAKLVDGLASSFYVQCNLKVEDLDV